MDISKIPHDFIQFVSASWLGRLPGGNRIWRGRRRWALTGCSINPIQQSGASRSLYSIADYFRFNPALVDAASVCLPEEQVRQMLAQAHAVGLKVMIDLVINHSAIDSPLTREHPEWFVRGTDGRVANAFCMDDRRKSSGRTSPSSTTATRAIRKGFTAIA